jgi:hypothetical protein
MSAEKGRKLSAEEISALLQQAKSYRETRYIQTGLGDICLSCVNRDYTALARIRHVECIAYRSADLREVNGKEYCRNFVRGRNLFFKY